MIEVNDCFEVTFGNIYENSRANFLECASEDPCDAELTFYEPFPADVTYTLEAASYP